jgi:hypothetical protein
MARHNLPVMMVKVVDGTHKEVHNSHEIQKKEGTEAKESIRTKTD